MKWLAGITLATAVSLGGTWVVLAESMNKTAVPSGEQVTGQVESVQGSTVMVKTATGDSRSYNVDPGVISALKLGAGSNVVIDGSRLTMGKIVHLDRYTTEVALDQGGEQRSYILTREARRFLTVGDRVVITSNSQVFRADRYKLTSADLRLQSAMVASSSSSSMSSTSTEVKAATGGGNLTVTPPPTSTPVEVEAPPAPVGGLW